MRQPLVLPQVHVTRLAMQARLLPMHFQLSDQKRTPMQVLVRCKSSSPQKLSRRTLLHAGSLLPVTALEAAHTPQKAAPPLPPVGKVVRSC